MKTSEHIIKQATLDDLNEITELLSQYLLFYQREKTKEAINAFIRERFEKSESIIFLAIDASNNDRAIGLTQLYPMFSTLSLGKVWILNDLYINHDYRKSGLGKKLIDAAVTFAKDSGAIRLDLKTEPENKPAKNLYEKYGFSYDETYCNYSLKIVG